MRDSLEKFVQEHREEVDRHEPPGGLWKRVEKRLHHKQRGKYGIYYRIAASLFIIIGAAILVMQRHVKKPIETPADTIAVATEIKEAQAYYASVVETKRAELKQFGNDYPDLFRDFNGELDTLNVAFANLETEYRVTNGNEAVMQALMQNMQLQVELLNRQIQIIQDIRKHKNKTGGNSSLM